MERKEFLTKVLIGTLGLGVATSCLSSCSSDKVDPDPTGGGGSNVGPIDFTIDLTSQEANDLKVIGGFIYKNKIVIAKVDTDSYVALAQACTHQGFSLKYEHSSGIFRCSSGHGGTYSLAGDVLTPPPPAPVKKYKTEMPTSTTLRIFA